MKRFFFVLMSFALLVGMTQCKKNLEVLAEEAVQGNHITLRVNRSRVIVDPYGHSNPDYATVDWEEGDVIYVGSGGSYRTYLTYNKNTGCFEGNIPTGDRNDYLHLYFIGNRGNTIYKRGSISDQTKDYPVISYGHTTELYDYGKTEYSATLYNKCAIVKFNTTDVDDNHISITGMKNYVTVNFGANNAATSTYGEPFTFTKEGKGIIKLHKVSDTESWAIVLPQDEVTDVKAYSSKHATQNFTMHEIKANGYYSTGIDLNLQPSDDYKYGPFTISDYGDVAFIAPGNLQATTSDNGANWTWSFAANQWDYIGNDSGNTKINGNGRLSISEGTVDLFGWSAEITYYGINNSTSWNDYNSKFRDWGTLSISGHPANTWRIFTKYEWEYIITWRDNAVNKRAVATVNNVHGLVLLPDDWTLPSECSFTATLNDWTTNTYNATSWAKMEDNGAVFLPAAMKRYPGQGVKCQDEGYYSTSTPDESYDNGELQFVLNNTRPLEVSTENRRNGLSVRLLREL